MKGESRQSQNRNVDLEDRVVNHKIKEKMNF